MHARIDNPAVTVPGVLQGLQALGTRSDSPTSPRQRCIFVGCVQPDQRLQHLRRHALARAQAGGRTGRANQHCHRLAGNPLLHRGRAGRPRTDRGCHASGRSARRRSPTTSGTRQHVTTTRRSSRRSSSRSRRSTPSTASMPPPGKSPATGHAGGSNRAGTQSRQPDPVATATAPRRRTEPGEPYGRVVSDSPLARAPPAQATPQADRRGARFADPHPAFVVLQVRFVSPPTSP